MASAVEKLAPLQPSNGLEALGHDIDLTELTLAFRSQASLSVIEMLTDGSLTRTVEGASTLTLTLHDRDRVIRQSGLLNKKTSVKIDGLWFRLVQVDVQGYDVQLTFEDREVAVLREFPPADAPHDGFKAVSVDKTTRVKFAQGLVEEPGKAGVLTIGFATGPSGAPPPKPITSSKDKPSDAAKSKAATPGLPKGKIKVQLLPATETQRAYLERVLDVGYSMDAPEQVLVMAVMTVTVESHAGLSMVGYGMCSGGGNALGIFQQCPGGGRPDNGKPWPASQDVETDSHAWFEVAKYAWNKYGSTSTLPWICSWIQRDFTWSSAHPGSEVAKWQQEAMTTVRYYLGTEIAPPKLPPPGKEAAIVVPPFDPGAGDTDTARMFTRGSRTTKGTRKTFKRETNWDALQRLASEVRWRCYCVSGTVWFITEKDLFASKPWMTVTPLTPGVDAIDGNYDIGKHNALVTIGCRIDMWEVPPGKVVLLDGTALFDGRWIVTSIERSLFSAAAKVTLKKPRPALPESSAPEYGQGQASGSEITLPKQKKGEGKAPADESPPPVIGPVFAGPCLEAAKKVKQLMDSGRIKVWNSPDVEDVNRAAQGLPCLDGVTVDCRVWKVMIWLAENLGPISTYAIHSSHGSDGLGGHSRGFAFDLNSIEGHDFGANDPFGTYVLRCAKALRSASASIRPLGMITTGWQGVIHDEARHLCIPDGSGYSSGAFYWGDVTIPQHTNHIHICYTPGIPT